MRAFPRILLITLLLPAAVWAQATPSDNKPAAHRMRRSRSLSRWLNITEQQKAQIQAYMKSYEQQARAIRQDSSLTAEQRYDKLKQLRAPVNQQMLSMFTPEQRQKAELLRERRRGVTRIKPPIYLPRI